MKIDKVIVHTSNQLWELNMEVKISSEVLQLNMSEFIDAGLPAHMCNYPIIMSVLHELIADIAEKTDNTFDDIVNDMKEIELEYPATGNTGGKIHYANTF